MTLFPQIQAFCEKLPDSFSKISPERQTVLAQISEYISQKINANQPVKLNFICTHNSRRSQLGQVLAKTAAAFYGFENIETFSGGTEATAFFINAVNALRRIGFEITDNQAVNNPIYNLKMGESLPEMNLFSKVFDDVANPQKNFCAVMVCSQADEACPVVFGAEKRISLPYLDPKRADETAEADKVYDETCELIATELFYVFDIIKKNP